MITYKHGNTEYSSLYELRKAFPNVSFPANPTSEQLDALQIEVIEIENEPINSIQTPTEPSFIERLEAIEEALTDILMGGINV